jgi:hypothetical protein
MSKPINTHIFKYVFGTISINFVFLVNHTQEISHALKYYIMPCVDTTYACLSFYFVFAYHTAYLHHHFIYLCTV